MKNEIEEVAGKWHRDNVVRNLSKESLETYNASLKDFLKYFDTVGVKRFKQITKDVIKSYIESQQQRGCSPRTINNRLKALRRLCNFYHTEMKPQYEVPKFILQKEAMSNRTPCTDEEVYRIIENISPNRKDSVLVALILETGIRSKTARNIMVEDLDLERGRLLCRVTKNGDPLVLPLCESIRLLLREYLHVFHLKSGYLFPNNIGGQMFDRSSIYKTITNFLRKICGLDRSGVHLFRYTFCRIMVENNCNAMILQKWLGHRTMDETKRYVRLYSDEMAKLSEEVTPLAANGKFLKNFTNFVDSNL